jgi:hypothetical protein
MTVTDSKKTSDRYFDLMGEGIDFDRCYATDVAWLVADTGEAIEGAHAVRDYVVALHASLTLHGPSPTTNRTSYRVARLSIVFLWLIGRCMNRPVSAALHAADRSRLDRQCQSRHAGV